MNNHLFNYSGKGENIIKKEIEVGTEVDAYCTKCKLILGHVVVAMVGKRPKKVECLTCHGQHAYKVSEPGSRAKAKAEKAADGSTEKAPKKAPAKKRAKSKRGIEKERELWRETLEKKDLASARPYSMADSYELDDVIDHNKFGMGIVTNVITAKKMEVFFENGRKCMVYNFSQ